MSENTPLEVNIRLAPEMPPEVTVMDECGASRAWFTHLDELVRVFRAEHRPDLFLLPERLLATDLETASVWFRLAGTARLLLALPEKTSLLTLPMPPLILAFRKSGSLSVIACKGNYRPEVGTPLFHAPLPNISSGGGVCLGSTVISAFDPLLETVPWDAFWGSAFSGHQASGKSHKYPEDVRLLLLELDRQADFPMDDLEPAGLTLGEWLARMSGQGWQI